MEFVANTGKNVEVEVSGDIYLRHAIQTRFITVNDNYIDIMKEYVTGIYQEGDIVSISEKIISICQNRTIEREDIRIGCLAINPYSSCKCFIDLSYAMIRSKSRR